MQKTINTKLLLSDKFQRLSVGAKALYMLLFCSADEYGIVDNVYRLIGINKYASSNLDDLVKAGYVFIAKNDSALVSDYFAHQDKYPVIDHSRLFVYDGTTVIDQVFFNLMSVKSVPKKRSAFVPPTLEEVREYAKERKSIVDPVAFFTYFDTPNERGETWVNSQGKPVLNWKGTFVTWEKNRRLKGVENGRSNSRNPQQSTEGHPKRVSERYNLSATSDRRG